MKIQIETRNRLNWSIMKHKGKLWIFWDSIPTLWIHLREDALAFPQNFPSCYGGWGGSTGLYNLIWSLSFLLPLPKLRPRDQIISLITSEAHLHPWGGYSCSDVCPSESCSGRFVGGKQKEALRLFFHFYCTEWPWMSAYYGALHEALTAIISMKYEDNSVKSISSLPLYRSGSCPRKVRKICPEL